MIALPLQMRDVIAKKIDERYQQSFKRFANIRSQKLNQMLSTKNFDTKHMQKYKQQIKQSVSKCYKTRIVSYKFDKQLIDHLNNQKPSQQNSWEISKSYYTDSEMNTYHEDEQRALLENQIADNNKQENAFQKIKESYDTNIQEGNIIKQQGQSKQQQQNSNIIQSQNISNTIENTSSCLSKSILVDQQTIISPSASFYVYQIIRINSPKYHKQDLKMIWNLQPQLVSSQIETSTNLHFNSDSIDLPNQLLEQQKQLCKYYFNTEIIQFQQYDNQQPQIYYNNMQLIQLPYKAETS